MKAKRLFFLVMAICLASGVKAQFYDSADDIYYYVEVKDGEFVSPYPSVMIFNFDGQKASFLNRISIGVDGLPAIRDNIKSNFNYYEEKVDNAEYDMYYDRSKNAYCLQFTTSYGYNIYGQAISSRWDYTVSFSSDRKYCYSKIKVTNPQSSNTEIETLKRVDKSYFKSGRSRTPNGTLYE